MKKSPTRSHDQKRDIISNAAGFTLVELSVVLILIGVMATAVLSTANTRIDAANLAASKSKMNFIVKSIAQFVDEYGYLPCPADPTIASGSANYGIGLKITDETDCDTTTLTGVTTVSSGSTLGYVGVLPHNTLGLAKQFEQDGWGRQITYAVTVEAVNQNTFSTATENIHLLSPATPTDINSTIYTGGYVVASHGKNGFGAYFSGVQISPTAGSNIEDQNSNLTLNFIQVFPHVDSDDIVRSAAIWQLKE